SPASGAHISGPVQERTDRGRELLLDRQPLDPPQSRAGQTPARRSPARLALVELSGLRPPAAARWMGGLRGFAFGLAWRVGRQRSPGGGLPAVGRAGTGEGSGKPLSVCGAWLAAGQRDVHRADAIAAERAEKPRRGARSPAVGQPGRGDSFGRSGSERGHRDDPAHPRTTKTWLVLMTSKPATLTPSLDDRKQGPPLNGHAKPVRGRLPAYLKPETGLDPAKPLP